MHDIKWIREEPQGLIRALVRRGAAQGDAEKQVGELIAHDVNRRAAIQTLEDMQARRNAASKEIGAAKKAKDEAKAETLMAEVTKLKAEIPQWEQDVRELDRTLDHLLAAIPNVPLDDVPDGKDEHDNVSYELVPREDLPSGTVPVPMWRGVNDDTPDAYLFQPEQHFEIGEALGMMDFEAAAKLSGSRFVVLKGQLARLERAIGQFFLDTHITEHGYLEVAPPVLVKDEAMFGTAQLPKFEDDQYYGTSLVVPKTVPSKYVAEAIEDFIAAAKQDGELDDEFLSQIGGMTLADLDRDKWDAARAYLRGLVEAKKGYASDVTSLARAGHFAEQLRQNRHWLIPTAEVPLTNLVANSILSEEELPKRYTALTPCFRAEAGSAGRDTRGMIRQHQFNKVEMVAITTPEQSDFEQERMLACAQAVLKKLGLHFRVMRLCTGDMGFASARTFDIEVWLPGQQAYREISSVSTCTDFQARRMNARYRPAGAKQARFVHTLNGSGVAVGRALVAILETYQNADGSVAIPDALKPYMGGLNRIERAQ